MYDFYNPKKRAIECVLRGNIGTVLVAGESFVPTPEQEKKGLTAESLENAGFVPKLLKPTPPVIRRRLLQASGEEIPEDILASTSHLAEFGGGSTERAPVDPEEVVSTIARGQKIFHRETIVPPTGLEKTSEEPSLKPAVESGYEAVEGKKAEESGRETPPLLPLPKPPSVEIPDELKHKDPDGEMTTSRSTQAALQQFAEAAEAKFTRGITSRRTRSRG